MKAMLFPRYLKYSSLTRALIFAVFFFCASAGRAADRAVADRICGKWMSAERNLVVQVYKLGNQFRAKIVWFRDDPGKPMEEWKDKNNPDPALRSRSILGMEILSGLKFDPYTRSWENGLIYDAKHGREWNASGYIDSSGQLHVRGYWHVKLIGRTMVFHRV